jgi:putative peptidoglycan lipid II flippase
MLRGPLGHGGLALANSIGVSLEVIGLLLIARRRLSGIDGRRIASAALRFVVGSIVMVFAIVVLQSIFVVLPLPDGITVSLTLRTAIEIGLPLIAAGVIGLIVYVITASALGSEEVRALPRMIRRRRRTS